MEKLYELFYETSGICTDTRNIVTNSLFIALKGNNFNANTFAKDAIEKGAKYAIVDEPSYANNSSIFFVVNSLLFLQNLAQFHRLKYNIPVIGITGSNGKTSTKELINVVLSQKYKVLCTKGNLNNHIGVPLTLLQLNETHEIAIIEMGANKPNDIKELCDITQPTHGIITNIGKAHLEGFVNFEGVYNTKTELYNAVISKNGQLITNSDDAILMNAFSNVQPCLTYGEHGEVEGELEELNPFITLNWKYKGYQSGSIQTHMLGKYNFYNFLAAISFGVIFNIDEERINSAIAQYVPKNNRSEIQETALNTLIVDCYNANPSSMKSALESFSLINHANKIAILGDMKELGNESANEHLLVLKLCDELQIEYFTIGEEFKMFNTNGFNTKADFLKYLASNNISGKLILLKCSRGIGLEDLIANL
jgi:UDP-N-acetylmuramoyl-tripeptide--D-alanyl-D-alanine ligase